MDPNEIIRPQEEKTVWVYGTGHKNEGQVAPPNTPGAFPVIRTTVYRRDGRVEVWQRSPDQGPEYGVLMPAPISSTDDKIAAQFQKDKEKEKEAASPVSAPPTQPNIVTRNPDGSLATTPNPNYTPDSSATKRPANAVPNIEGTPLPGGGFDNSRPIKVWRTPDGQQAGAPEELNATERQRWEQEKNQAAGRGYKTDAEVANPKPGEAGEASSTKPVEGRPGWRQVTARVTKDGKSAEETYYLDPNGQRQDTLPGQPKSAEASDALEGQEGWRVVKRAKTDAQGNSVTETVYVDPQGQEHATPPAKQPTSAEVKTPVKDQPGWTEVKTGKKDAQGNETGETYYLDPQGNRQSSLPDKNNIKGVPSFTPDLTKPGVGLIDRAKQLDELLAAGTITWEQRQRVLQADQTLASTVANEFNLGASILREDFQSQVSQRNVDVSNVQHRASLANTHAQNAFALVQKFAPYLGAEQGRTGSFFTSLMAGQLALATSYGGMKDFPREQLPTALREFAERAVGTTPRAGAAAPSAPAPTLPTATAAPAAAAPAVPVAPAVAATDTTDAGGVPREYTPASATNGPVAMGPRPSPAAERLFGPQMPPPRPAEADSWRQQALDRQAVALGQNVIGAPPPVLGVDDGQDAFNRPMAPVLNTQIPGLSPEMDAIARQQLDTDYLGIG